MKKILIVFSIMFVSLTLGAMTPPPPLHEQVMNSHYVAKVNLTVLKETQVNKNLISVSAQVETIQVYKEMGTLPKKFNISYSILPEYFGKWLKASPKSGEYIMFFIDKEVSDKNGKKSNIISLYEPHPYAFKEWTQVLEDDIKKFSN